MYECHRQKGNLDPIEGDNSNH
ncbi:hypothetical protein VCHENC02_0597A, partial [Vibrio harveyi]